MDTYSSRTSMGGKGKLDKMLSGEPSRHEDRVTSTIEKTTAKVPSVTFLTVAIGAMAGSLGFFLAGRKDAALFIATWVPTILIMGNYNKIVKALENVETGGLGAGSLRRETGL